MPSLRTHEVQFGFVSVASSSEQHAACLRHHRVHLADGGEEVVVVVDPVLGVGRVVGDVDDGALEPAVRAEHPVQEREDEHNAHRHGRIVEVVLGDCTSRQRGVCERGGRRGLGREDDRQHGSTIRNEQQARCTAPSMPTWVHGRQDKQDCDKGDPQTGEHATDHAEGAEVEGAADEALACHCGHRDGKDDGRQSGKVSVGSCQLRYVLPLPHSHTSQTLTPDKKKQKTCAHHSPVMRRKIGIT